MTLPVHPSTVIVALWKLAEGLRKRMQVQTTAKVNHLYPSLSPYRQSSKDEYVYLSVAPSFRDAYRTCSMCAFTVDFCIGLKAQ